MFYVYFIMESIVLSFIGKLPDYTVDCIHQIRLYTDVKIYIIQNDTSLSLLEAINKYPNIEFIKYEHLLHYTDNLRHHQNKFAVVNGLKERRELFYRSFERFYLLYGFMDLNDKSNILFMEIDNLIYDDPKHWISKIDQDISFMIDNENRASTGIFYVKTKTILKLLLDHFDNIYLNSTRKFYSEMGAVYDFYEMNKSRCYILPSFVDNRYMNENCTNFNKINRLFDPSSYGIFFYGLDSIHASKNNGEGTINPWGSIKNLKIDDLTWISENGLKKPFYKYDGKMILICNLHVHSKDLKKGLSA